MRFSQKIGKTPVRESLQVDDIDDRLKNKLWLIICERFIYRLPGYAPSGGVSDRTMVVGMIWIDFMGLRHDKMPRYENKRPVVEGVIEELEHWYFQIAKWYDIYDLIEFLASLNEFADKTEFVELCNISLKQEVAGYRIIDRVIVKVTSEEEIESIEEAISVSDTYMAVKTHLNSALSMLANRELPDYRNSIKESISAVEAFCKIVINEPKATLGKALAVLESKYHLHPSLKESYGKLYGYTSDAQGIRHSLLEDDNPIEFEDAKFMLVSCSAFISYLKAKLQL